MLSTVSIIPGMETRPPERQELRGLLTGHLKEQLLAREARLIAERDGADAIDFPPALQARQGEAAVAKLLAGERAVFKARRRAIQGRIDIFRKRIVQLGKEIGSLAGHKVAVGSLTFINEGRYLVSMGHEQTVKFWDTETWREARTHELNLPGARGPVYRDGNRG